MIQVIFNALQTTLSGGIGRYSYELSKSIYIKKKIDFKIVIREEDIKMYSFANKDDLIIVKNIKNGKDRNYYEQFVLPKYVKDNYPKAIIHYADSMAPLLAKNKIVITVHDFAFKTLKGAFTWKTSLWKNIITSFSIKKANIILCDTNFTKYELNKYYPKYLDKAETVYIGFNDFSKDSIDYNNISPKILSLQKQDYILTVSTISPRKNIDGLIEALNLIKNRINHKLVIAGKDGWLYENVYKKVEELKLKDKVIFTGGINDDELKFLYKNSKLFVYPSFYEGFGLPPLEAMSFGVPVVVSNKTSIPEVVNINACFFDPKNLEEMSIKILEVINNEESRNYIIENGYKRIKNFSWEKCAADTVEIYEKMYKKYYK